MLDPNFLSTLNDADLARAAWQFEDPMTSTPMEIELRKRFEALLEEVIPLREQEDTLANHDPDAADLEKLGDALIVDTSNTVALLEVIGEAGVDDPKALKADLELARDFRAFTEDAGDVLTRLSQLSQLSTTVQE